MKKTSYLLLPIAAFALAASSAYAFNPEFLAKAGLSSDQIAAFEEAHELKKKGDKDAARNILAAAGIDLDTLEEVRTVFHKEHALHHEAVESAIKTGDYGTFMSIERKGQLAKITDESDFDKLVEAHALREAGDKEGARLIMEELGIKRPQHAHSDKYRGMKGGSDN